MESYLSQIQLFSFNWAPQGFALCSGQLLPIAQNQALFSLLGSYFGGDGRTNFGVPDLRGRVPCGLDFNSPFYSKNGSIGGAEDVTLWIGNMPAHSHALTCSTAAGSTFLPEGSVLAQTTSPSYAVESNLVEMSPNALPTSTGGGQSHTNVQPSQVINFCIAIDGIYPSRN